MTQRSFPFAHETTKRNQHANQIKRDSIIVVQPFFPSSEKKSHDESSETSSQVTLFFKKNPTEAPIYLCFASINAWMTQTVVIF